MAAIIFDLDNTLYSEETYVKSGFKAVASYLTSKYGINEEYLFSKMMTIFNEDGRGSVFNRLIEELKLPEDIFSLVYVYRYHVPNISLYDDAKEVLIQLKNQFKLGLITDGRSFVQKRKVDALDIVDYFDVIIFTDVLGEGFWKPSVKPFELALNYLNSKAENSYYVGDDPYKDFKAPKQLGMGTIQVKIEEELDYWKLRGYCRIDANFCINSLSNLCDMFIDNDY